MLYSAESQSDSSDSSSQSDTGKSGEEETALVILSEDEMNKLGAKIMKAELMGNQV